MFGTNEFTSASHVVDVDARLCPESGATRATVRIRPADASVRSVYVGHPISGIRVGRIAAMQDEVAAALSEAGGACGLRVVPLFPMRTTHLSHDEVGASEYETGASLFSDTRHYTLQNRLDALVGADGVLVNFMLADDAGAYRVSKGMPFDYGWARAKGKPCACVISRGNPNWTAAIGRAAHVSTDLREAADSLVAGMAGRGDCGWRTIADVFDFTGAGPSLAMLSELAEADAAKHSNGGSAILTVMPEGPGSAAWHGQVRQVSDWILADRTQAVEVVRQLGGMASGERAG